MSRPLIGPGRGPREHMATTPCVRKIGHPQRDGLLPMRRAWAQGAGLWCCYEGL